MDGSLRAENALVLLAVLYDRMDEEGETVAIWKEYLERFPTGIYRQEALEKLSKSE
jgi:hypothetical protein